MKKILEQCKLNLPMILLVIGSVGVIVGYCYGFMILLNPKDCIALGIAALMIEVLLATIMGYRTQKSYDLGVVQLIHLCAAIILMVVAIIMGFRYLQDPGMNAVVVSLTATGTLWIMEFITKMIANDLFSLEKK